MVGSCAVITARPRSRDLTTRHPIGECMKNCNRCNGFGSKETYDNQAVLPLNGKSVCVDWCIHHIVTALNASGIETVACCCGHGQQDGRIDLADGRILVVKSN
jgi:hypothetical protein